MRKIYKPLIGITALLFGGFTSKAQLAGTYSVPATYTSIAAAIADLNTLGVNGPVNILIDANYTETAPVGGYTLTATGTLANPIVFQKNGIGANPLIMAYAGGVGTPGTAFQDGVWRLIGSDYITIDGIDIVDPNAANPATMEFGYGLFKASATDGCQNNTIKNCLINLNTVNNAFGTLPASDGSRGIDVVNALSGAHTTALIVTSAAGANSNNKFYSNIIQNCNIGIAMIGYTDFSPFTNADWNNDIGGAAPLTGNSIVNYGGAPAAVYPADAVRTSAQYSVNVSFNIINNNNGAGVNHVNTLRGIYLNTAQSANASIRNNTVTLKGGGTTAQLFAIYNLSGSTAASNSITITNNLITNCTYTSASSGAFYGIYNTGAPSVLSINNNTLSNNSTNASSGSYYNIYNGGAANNQINIINNLVNLGTFSASSTSAILAGIYNISGTATTSLSVISNTLQNAVFTGTGTSTTYLIYSGTTQSVSAISANSFNNLSMNHSGTIYFIYNCNATPFNSVTNNSIVTAYSKNLSGGTVYGYYNGCANTGSTTISGNNYSNITLINSTLYGFYNLTSTTNSLTISSNTVSNVVNGGASSVYGMYTYYPYKMNDNVIKNISCGATMAGIYIPSGSSYAANIYSNTIAALTTTGSTLYGLYASPSTTFNVFKNKVYDLSITNPSGLGTLYGMYFAAGAQNNISNNYVGDLRTPFANAALPLLGIYVAGGTVSNLFYNTVYLNATSTGFSFGSAALYASTTPGLNLRNNILINLSVPNGGQYTAAYRRTSSTIATYSATSNNNIFYAGVPGVNNVIFYDGITIQQTLGNFQTLVAPRDNNSKTESTPFLSVVGTSPSFLHVDPAAPSLAESGAVNIVGYTDDYDNDIRQGNIGYAGTGTAPDIGADEFNANVVNCNVVVGGSVAPTSPYKCIGQSVTLNGSGYTSGYGIGYQWQVGTLPGGPYVNVVGGNGPNYPQAYTSPTLALGTYYYVLLTTCSISGLSAVSQEATVTVLGFPTVAVTPSVSTICMPGGSAITLSASGANSYTWGPAAGLTGTVGATVNAFPAATTIYTLIGTNLGGCSSTITTQVNVAEYPNMTSISASPTLVCGGGSSSLTTSGVTTTTYVVSNISYSAIPTPTTGVTTLCSAGVAVTPLASGSLDDGGWININMPFNFNFYGNVYSSFAVSTNGFLVLGSGLPNTFTGYGSAHPYTFAGRPSISPIYADLDFRYVGVIETFTTGVAPFRKVVVNYSNGQFYSNTGSLTAQAIIYESTNVIEAHVNNSTGNNAAVQAIQDAAGLNALPVAGRNAVTWPIAIPDGKRWSPAGGPLTYSWTPATYLNNPNIATPVANSVTSTITYTATGTTSLGCSASTVITVLADVNPTITITGTNAVCSTSVVNLSAGGAVTYTWSTGAISPTMANTPTASVVYSVTGTSSTGCLGTSTKSITMNITPTVNIAGASTVCAGSFINLTANGANTYSWSNGSTLLIISPVPSVTTTYSILGTNAVGGCTNVASKTVSLVSLPTVTITPSPTGTICVGENISLIASAGGADTYSWSTGSASAIAVASPTTATAYTVYVSSNVTGCSNSGTIAILVKECVGIEELSSGINGLLLYPNPNNGEFTIELSNGLDKKVEISDLTGRIVFTSSSDRDKININMTNLANGLYYVKILSEKKSEVFKVIKQ